jgi:hypothetical protein
VARWIGFIIAILVGVALGLGYGWIVSPVHYVDTSPDTLRVDYRTDYVLMVAEAYKNEIDPGLAVRRLALLDNTPPQRWFSGNRVCTKIRLRRGGCQPDAVLVERIGRP